VRSFFSFSGDEVSDALGLTLFRKRLNDLLVAEGVLDSGTIRSSSKAGGLMYSSVCVSVRLNVNSLACGREGGIGLPSSILSFFLSKSFRGIVSILIVRRLSGFSRGFGWELVGVLEVRQKKVRKCFDTGYIS
jgi:hypothetical protein